MIINWLWYPFFFSKHEKDAKKNLMKICLEIFRIWPYAWQQNIFVFVFEKGNWFKSLWDFFEDVLKFFFWNISEETEYFNTGFVFYSVNIQPDIMQNG